MYEEALFIEDLAGSGLVSDRDVTVLSENFYAKFGCHWTEILN